MTREEKSFIMQDFGNSAYSIVITTALLPIFFKDFAGSGLDGYLSTTYWGYGNAIATILIAILSPILGAMADFKGRKKKMFIFFMVIGTLFTASLTFVGEGQYLLCLIIYIITVIGFSGSNLINDSFLVDITTNERMDYVSSMAYGIGYIGGTIPFLVSIFLISFSSKIGITTITATKISFLITAIWWLGFSIPMMRNAKQTYYVEEDKEYIKKSFISILKTLKKIKKDKNLVLFLVAFFFYIDGVHTIITMATPFAADIGIGMSGIMGVLIFLQIVAFPFAIIYGKLSKKIGTKKTILIAIITYSIVSIYALFINSLGEFLFLGFLVGSAQGGVQALSRSLYGRLIPKEHSAEYFGIYNIFGRISSAVGPFLVSVVASITKETRYGVVSLIFLFIIGGIIFLKVKDPIENNVQI